LLRSATTRALRLQLLLQRLLLLGLLLLLLLLGVLVLLQQVLTPSFLHTLRQRRQQNVGQGVTPHHKAAEPAAQHSTAQHSTAQHSTAQHSTAQHSTAQHSTAQHGSPWQANHSFNAKGWTQAMVRY
jgi:predicted lipid-binding transport protein (Tim44 family)